MTYSGNVTKQIEEVRRRTITVLDDLVQKAEEFDLAEPPPVLERYHRKLRENSYQVLVAGGTNRGKSTFVNALLGRDVFPTGVATGRVFNIRASQREAYRIRFEDGSEREISPEDLPLYGSLTTANAGRLIRWIEVDAPVRFLPEGLSLLDTSSPLYANRFVPEADAVVFVLDSGQPITGDDLEFIEKILNVTHEIFFIQTKVDLYAEENWRYVQRLNQEILEEKFEGRIASTNIWPISSTNLRKATTGDGEDCSMMTSLHRELAVALREFLAGVVGWNRVAETILLALRYHAAGREALSGRLAGFAAESKQKHSEMQQTAAESKRRFEEDWGPRGQKYLALRENLQRVVAVGKQSFQNALQMGGDIELAQKAKIDEIKTLAEANRIAREMPDEVVTAAMDTWTRVCEEVQHRCAELLEPFADASGGAPGPNVYDSAISNSGIGFKTDYFMMLRGAASGIIVLTAASVVVAAAGVSLPPLGLIAIPVLLMLMVGGILNVRKNQLKSARQELRMHLVEVLQRVRRHFFDVDLISGRFSRMDEHFSALERSLNEQVREIVEQKSGDTNAEITYLTETTKQDDRKREMHATETHEHLIEWDTIGKSARDVMALITEQAGDTVAFIGGSSRVPPVLRRPDETLPGSDEKDPVDPGPVSSSPSEPAPLDRYHDALEAPPAAGRPDKTKPDRFGIFPCQPGLSGEQAADHFYAELKRQPGTKPDRLHERTLVQLRWAFVVAAILAVLAWGYWSVLT